MKETSGVGARSLPLWSELSPEVMEEEASRDPVVVLPLAATEQHGPHLPLSTDVDIGVGVLAEAFRCLPEEVRAWTLPMRAVGASLEHARFEGTQSVSAVELVDAIVRVGASLASEGVRRLVLSNSHGGNRYAMEAAGLILRAEHDMLVVKASWPRLPRPDGVELPEAEWRHGLHGGALETAMMLHLRPESVDGDAIADFTSLGTELERTLRLVGPEGAASFAWLAGDLNPDGVVGDATLATAEMGARLVRHYGRALAEVIQDAAEFPVDRLAPAASGAVDETAAWELVGAVRSRVRSDTRTRDASPIRWPIRVTASSTPEVGLNVRADGAWDTTARVTEAARELLDLYLPLAVEPDLVIGQLGQSVDGRIATESGASHYVTGSADIERLHRLRALVDAVVVGASTVEHDDPRLTVRLVEGEDPVRVLLDPAGRLEPRLRVFSGPPGATLVVRGADGPGPVGEAGEELRIPRSAPGELDLGTLLRELRSRGLRSILVEGGGLTVSKFLERGLLDRLHIAVAPMLIGSGRASISLEPIAGLGDALRPACRRFTLGEDVLFDFDLRSPPA